MSSSILAGVRNIVSVLLEWRKQGKVLIEHIFGDDSQRLVLITPKATAAIRCARDATSQSPCRLVRTDLILDECLGEIIGQPCETRW
jgi:hypothetical protein